MNAVMGTRVLVDDRWRSDHEQVANTESSVWPGEAVLSVSCSCGLKWLMHVPEQNIDRELLMGARLALEHIEEEA